MELVAEDLLFTTYSLWALGLTCLSHKEEDNFEVCPDFSVLF